MKKKEEESDSNNSLRKHGSDKDSHGEARRSEDGRGGLWTSKAEEMSNYHSNSTKKQKCHGSSHQQRIYVEKKMRKLAVIIITNQLLID